jgi:hypothetical protein
MPRWLIAGCLAWAMMHTSIALAQSAEVSPTRRAVSNIEVLEYPADARTRVPQYTTATAPAVRYGGADVAPQFDLTWVSYAKTLSDGRIATLSRVGARLLVFGRDGRPERAIGRLGKGPGEFTRPLGIALGRGDSLVLVDPANNRLAWVLADRGVVREQSLSSRFHRELAEVEGVLPDGALVLSGVGRLQHGTGTLPNRPSAAIGLVSPRTGESTLITSVPDLPLVVFETRYRGRRERAAFHPRLGEYGQVAVWTDQLVTGDGSAMIQLHDARGRVVRRVRVPGARRPVTRAMRTVVIERELNRMRGPRSESMVDKPESERLAREAPFADSLPVVGKLLVGSDGLLWIVDPIVPGEAAWSAIGMRKDGVIVARVSSRIGIPMAFSANSVLVRVEDSDGVVSLARYPLVQLGRAP